MSNRRLRRFFTEDSISAEGDKVFLSPPETDHLRRILRLKEGAACRVTNRDGVQAEAVVKDLSGAKAELLIERVAKVHPGNGIPLFVYPAFIQKGKMDEIVRHLQELGIQGFFPAETERTVVKMSEEAGDKVVQRWEKIVQEAAKQSGSADLMLCEAPRKLQALLERIPRGDTKVFFHPGAEAVPFRKWIAKHDFSAAPMHLFFGPEGGFSAKEEALFNTLGAVQVGLGETILRADTAVLGAAAAIRFFAYDRKSES